MGIKSKVYALTEKNGLIKYMYLVLHNVKVRKRLSLTDDEFAKKYYYEATKKQLNLETPQSFDEKQWWLKIHYRNPLMTQCVDKYRVREYVSACGLEHILNELYDVYDGISEIDLSKLPSEFFIKTNHGCACNFLYNDRNKYLMENILIKMEKNLKENYYYQSREWPYKNVKPKIIAEKVLKSQNNTPLIDFRFLCFEGKCHYIFIDIDTADEQGRHKVHAKRNVYSKSFELLPVKVGRDNFAPELIQKPENLDEMIAYVEILSKPFPFVRVDLYNVDGKIIFGEMTFYHAGSSSVFDPWSFSDELGDLIKLPNDEYVV